MPIFPKPLSEKAELDYKLGIKSSLNHIASVIALTYALFLANGKKSRVIYSDEYIVNGATKIQMNKDILDYLLKTFISSTESSLNSNPLFQAQMEALQVGIQLIYKLARVSFVDGSSSTRERTGGNRYAKQLDFGTNMLLLDTVLSAYQYEDVVYELGLWLSNSPSNSVISKSIKRILAIFSEDIPAKLRSADGQEIVFTQQGIYERFLEGQSVVGSDAKENVGTFRVFNSIIKENVHPFIQSTNGYFVSREPLEVLKEYNDMVVNSSFMLPKRIIITTESIVDKYEAIDNRTISNKPLQVIYYGAPGTGKSHQTDLIVESDKDNQWHQRTIFHPDSDYSSFVGCYKPTKENDKLTYKFIPQAFLKAYVAAWKNLEQPYYLIIEEINRGNCAQIFGDIFQLLDRREDGFSKYHITSDTDIEAHLLEAFKGLDLSTVDLADINTTQIVNGQIMQLPNNLHIYATMNTSDQSLFPIDSAFKRRWDWEYKPIEQGKDKDGNPYDWQIHIGTTAYDWWDFLQKINAKVQSTTHSEDKKMGFWFTRPQAPKSYIDKDRFISKVLFYLWNDVYKDFAETNQTIFQGRIGTDEVEKYTFTDFFRADGKIEERLQRFMKFNEVDPVPFIDDSAVSDVADNPDTDANTSYWAKFIELLKKTPITKAMNLENYSVPKNSFQVLVKNNLDSNAYTCIFASTAQKMGYVNVSLYVGNSWEVVYKYLNMHEGEISEWFKSQNFDAKLEWRKNAKSRSIVLSKKGGSIEWQADTFAKLYEYFSEILANSLEVNNGTLNETVD